MTDDPNRKSLRQFQCRDYLWDTFEQMAQDLECSPDYLINEAMRHYARSQGKLRQTMAPGVVNRGADPRMSNPNGAMPRPPGAPSAAPAPMLNPNSMGAPMQRAPGPPPMGAPNGVRPMPGAPAGYPPPNARPMPMGAPPPQAPQAPAYPQPPQAQRVPQPPAYPGAPAGNVLYAVFEGQKYPIVKDEFYIGRSNKSCDLIVKDPNVSRQHARIVRHQGQFWMVDMGSTNGIEFQGTRVDRRPIGEGDVFRICDHEIVFTYR